MGYKKAEKHSVTVGFSASNPTDATNYRFLTDELPLSAPGSEQTIWLENVVVTKVMLSIKASAYSDEAWTIALHSITAGTPMLTMTQLKYGVNSTAGRFVYDGSVLFPRGWYTFNTTTPAWATNPTGLKSIGFIEYIQL